MLLVPLWQSLTATGTTKIRVITWPGSSTARYSWCLASHTLFLGSYSVKLPFRYNLLVTLQIILVVFSQLLSHATAGVGNLTCWYTCPRETKQVTECHIFTVFVLSVCDLTVLRAQIRGNCVCEINAFRHDLHCCQAWALALGNQQCTSGTLSQRRNAQSPMCTDCLMRVLWTWARRKTIVSLNDFLFTCFHDFLDLTFTDDNSLYVPKRTENKFLQNVDINTQSTKK